MQQKLSPKIIGLIFLLFGLGLGIPSLASNSLSGGIMGFCTFATLFGLVMLCMPNGKST